MKSPRILLVEDEMNIADALLLNLELEGYQVWHTIDGPAGLELLAKNRIDLVILDVMLPSMSGLDVCKAIRLQNKFIPILFLSARGTAFHRIQGLQIGANDYLAKPFDLEELLLRVKNLLTITQPRQDHVEAYSFGGNSINFNTYEAITYNNESIILTKKQIQLLKLLMDNANQVISRKEVLEVVWGYDTLVSTRTIDNFIMDFRKFFEEIPQQPSYFISIRGVGYMFRNFSS